MRRNKVTESKYMTQICKHCNIKKSLCKFVKVVLILCMLSLENLGNVEKIKTR